MTLSYKKVGQLMLEWKPERPENGRALGIAIPAGVTAAIICFGFSTPSDWPGNLIAAVLFGFMVGGITFAGISK